MAEDTREEKILKILELLRRFTDHKPGCTGDPCVCDLDDTFIGVKMQIEALFPEAMNNVVGTMFMQATAEGFLAHEMTGNLTPVHLWGMSKYLAVIGDMTYGEGLNQMARQQEIHQRIASEISGRKS